MEMEQQSLNVSAPSHNSTGLSDHNPGVGKVPKLPAFKEGQDEMDRYRSI